MKIKIYIVTYNDSKALNSNLNSLFLTDNLDNVELFVINNHSNFELDERYRSKVTVLHNMVRPDFSKGYLTRNWNQAIINGFQDLQNPQCDILVHCQDDSIWLSNWKQNLIETHNNYSFYTCGWGDALCSYTPDAVKNIGLWDERFNALSHHEADYFLRAFLYNREKSSINDHYHQRILNPTLDIISRPENLKYSVRPHNGRAYVIDYTFRLFEHKWGKHVAFEHWDIEKMKTMDIHPLIENFLLYPYFEKDILLDKHTFSYQQF